MDLNDKRRKRMTRQTHMIWARSIHLSIWYFISCFIFPKKIIWIIANLDFNKFHDAFVKQMQKKMLKIMCKQIICVLSDQKIFKKIRICKVFFQIKNCFMWLFEIFLLIKNIERIIALKRMHSKDIVISINKWKNKFCRHN